MKYPLSDKLEILKITIYMYLSHALALQNNCWNMLKFFTQDYPGMYIKNVCCTKET